MKIPDFRFLFYPKSFIFCSILLLKIKIMKIWNFLLLGLFLALGACASEEALKPESIKGRWVCRGSLINDKPSDLVNGASFEIGDKELITSLAEELQLAPSAEAKIPFDIEGRFLVFSQANFRMEVLPSLEENNKLGLKFERINPTLNENMRFELQMERD